MFQNLPKLSKKELSLLLKLKREECVFCPRASKRVARLQHDGLVYVKFTSTHALTWITQKGMLYLKFKNNQRKVL